MKKRISMDVFREHVLPSLQAKHAKPEDLQKAINDDFEVFEADKDGKESPVVVDVKSLTGAGDKVDEPSEASIEKAMTDVLEKMSKRLGDRPRIENVKDNAADDPKAGFKNLGDFGRAVMAHATHKSTDPKLFVAGKALPSSYMSEAVGSDGGFLVPTDFRNEIMSLVSGTTAILPRTTQLTTTSNSLEIPVDESMPFNQAGISAYWTAELGKKTASKPELRTVKVDLFKVAALVVVSDEMLQDSFAGLNQYLAKKSGDAITEACNTAFINGTGVGQPLGYRNTAALVTVAKETSQTADTINVANLAKMFAALTPGSMSKADWMLHSTAFPQIVQATIGNQPVFVAPGGLKDAPSGTLMGRPIIFSQDAAQLGDKGDIDLVDWTQYLTVTKTTGVEEAMSIHLYFDYDATTFRFVFRVGGRPWMSKPITQKDGVTTNSPFVTLADRA